MRRRSRAGGNSPNAQASKAAARKSRIAPKAVRSRDSSGAREETKVARLTRERDEALARQTATAEILRVISQSPTDARPVCDSIVLTAARLLRCDLVMVLLCDGATYSHGVVASPKGPFVDRGPKNFPIDPSANFPSRAIVDKKMLHLPDWSLIDLPEQELKIRKRFGVNSALYLPLLRGGDCIGLLTLVGKRPNTFGAAEIAQAESFRDQALIAIENARLFEAEQQRSRELAESLEQQTATSVVLSAISSSPGDLQLVFQSILTNATRICEAQFGTIFRYDGKGLVVVAWDGVPPRYLELLQSAPVPIDEGTVTGRAAKTEQVIHVTDILAEMPHDKNDALSAKLVAIGGVRTLLVVPMLKEGQLLGAISIYRTEVRAFSDKQIGLVTNFSKQAIIAIENARLLNELRESLEQQTATSDVLRVISSSPADIQPVLETIGERAEKLCNAEISLVSIVDGELIRLASAHGMPEAGLEAVRRAYPMRLTDETVIARAIRTRAVCHVADVLSDPQYQLKDTARVSGVRGSLSVPMVRDKQVVGAIFVARRQPGLFSDTQVQLLNTFADQAVIAIENVRLFKETKNSLEQQTATADVLKLISRSTFDLPTVLQTLVESAARFCNADKANIIRDRDGVFYTAEAYGHSREFLDYIKNIPIKAERGSASGRALVEGKVVHITDAAADPEYTLVEARRLGDYRTILCVPMLREGVPIGVLVLTRSDVQPFTDTQIELVTTYADQAAIAIENVRLFESEQDRTRQLTKSLEDLRTTQDRLVQTQKLASLGQLTAGIAHEIKNPLNFVNNFSGVSVEMIEELQEALGGMRGDAKTRAEITELANTLHDNLNKIVQHGKRADSIVKNMLLHSREGSGEHRLVDINAVVEGAVNLAYHGARAEKQGFNITLERTLGPAAGQVDCFPQEITRVLLNLISNGFYAATQRKAQVNGGYEPTLTAATRNLGDRVEIRIRDNGTGIPPEAREKMFNPFFTTKPAGEGTGLGLSISHDIIVKQHAGSIEVDTQPGEFTEVRIILPRTVALITDSRGRA